MEQSTEVAHHLELNFKIHSLIVELADNRKLAETYRRYEATSQAMTRTPRTTQLNWGVSIAVW